MIIKYQGGFLQVLRGEKGFPFCTHTIWVIYAQTESEMVCILHESLEISWEMWAVYNEKYWYICIVREPVTLIMLLLRDQSLLTSCWPRPAILPDWSRWDRLFLGKSGKAHIVDRSLSNLLFYFWLLGAHQPHFLIIDTKTGSHKLVGFFLKLCFIRCVVTGMQIGLFPDMRCSLLTQNWFFSFPLSLFIYSSNNSFCYIFHWKKRIGS